jgi:hypothetical protein
MIRSLNFPKLPKFLTLKGIPEPFNQLMRPLVLVSMGLHAALLLAPIPSPQAKPKPEAKPKTVKITALPPIKSKSLAKTKLSAKALLRKPRLSPVVVVHKGLVIKRASKKTISKVAQAPNQKTPKAKDSPPPVPPVQPNTGGAASPDSSNPWSDFPHYPKAGPGCLGLQSCFESADALDVIVQHFEKQLPLKKYEAKREINEKERVVFQVSKGGTTQYLNILSEGSATVYVLAENPKTRADLQQAVQIPPDFSDQILAQLPTGKDGESTDPSPDQFASANDFFSDLGGDAPDGSVMAPKTNPEIDSMKLVSGQTPQQLFSTSFEPSLKSSGYESKPGEVYGGGQLYELKKGTSKPFYLNLVPTKDGKGTVIVVWLSKPG